MLADSNFSSFKFGIFAFRFSSSTFPCNGCTDFAECTAHNKVINKRDNLVTSNKKCVMPVAVEKVKLLLSFSGDVTRGRLYQVSTYKQHLNNLEGEKNSYFYILAHVIICYTILHQLSQAYHNPPPLYWFGTDRESIKL